MGTHLEYSVAVICHFWYFNGMKFRELMEIVADEPVFETELLVAGQADPADLRRQLSRWTKAGKLHQLRRGLYALVPPFQKMKPHPFVVANRLVRSSYVTSQSALAFYGMIPEHVSTVTSVTTLRPGQWKTSLGIFQFQHIRSVLFLGYRRTDLGGGQGAFVATPEKALFDLIYLQPGADSLEYLRELRLQHLDQLNTIELMHMVDRIQKPKLQRAAANILELVHAEKGEYETL
jgi:predicted transcriptional regulator of viral defense system